MLGATLAASMMSENRRAEELAVPLTSIKSELAGWTAVGEETLDARALSQLRPTTYLYRTYRKDTRDIGLFIAWYSQQRAGETMHSPKHCLTGSGWQIWKHATTDVPLGDRVVQINRYSIRNGLERMLVFYWYQSKERIIASEYEGKLLLVRDVLAGGSTAGSIVRLTMPDVPGAEEYGLEMVRAVMPEVQRCFR